MSTIETLRAPSSVQAWIESLNNGQEEKSQNMIKMMLACEKSSIEHRSSNISNTCENVVCAQPSVCHEQDEIQNSIFEYGSSKFHVKLLKRMIGNQQPKELKRSKKMRPRVGLKLSRKRKPHLTPGKTRKTMKLYSGSLYLLEKMVKNIMT